MRVCVGALRGAEEGRGPAPVVPSAQICAKVWCTVRTVATEASDFCKRSARVRPMSFVAYPRARESETPVPKTEGFASIGQI